MNQADKEAFKAACREKFLCKEERELGEFFFNAALAHARSGEAVAWQFKHEGKWHTGMEANNHRGNTQKAGYEIRELFTHSQVSPESGYIRGHKDHCEWSAQMAEATDPITSDWLYDDRHELAKALRKGPDFGGSQPDHTEQPREMVSVPRTNVLPGAPERIYLVIEDDGNDETPDSFLSAEMSAGGEIMWSPHRQGPSDIEYMLAAAPSPAVAQGGVNKELLEALKNLLSAMVGRYSDDEINVVAARAAINKAERSE